MEAILDSVRRIVARWANTRSQIIANVMPGDTTINVKTAKRFVSGDEIMIRTATQGETPLVVDEIVSETVLSLTTPIRFRWEVADYPIVEKTFNQMFLQGVYMGEPDNIPRFPAVTVSAISRDSEWLTLDSTKEQYNLQLSIYVENVMQEEGYRFLLRMVDTIQHGLKQNIYPLVAPYNTVSLITNAVAGDVFIKVSDTSSFEVGNRIFIEDQFDVEEKAIMEIVDSQTLRVSEPGVCQDWSVIDNTQIIRLARHIYNSWPSSIEFGTIFKGTLLKAATIKWFAWEEELQQQPPVDTHLQ